VLKLSGGRLGWQAGKMPVLELTTTGRKSGRRRSVMLHLALAGGFDDRDRRVAGRRRHASGVVALNLRDNPDVEVAYKGGAQRPMRARIASPDERRPLVAARHRRPQELTRQYQTKTTREIPLVLLEPVS